MQFIGCLLPLGFLGTLRDHRQGRRLHLWSLPRLARDHNLSLHALLLLIILDLLLKRIHLVFDFWRKLLEQAGALPSILNLRQHLLQQFELLLNIIVPIAVQVEAAVALGRRLVYECALFREEVAI